MGQSVSGDENSRRLNDEYAVPTIRFARPRSNSLAAIAPARVASSIHASWALFRAQSSWVLLFLPPPQPSPASGEGGAPSSCTVVLYLFCSSRRSSFTPPRGHTIFPSSAVHRRTPRPRDFPNALSLC